MCERFHWFFILPSPFVGGLPSRHLDFPSTFGWVTTTFFSNSGTLAGVTHPLIWRLNFFLVFGSRSNVSFPLHDSCAFHPLGILLLFVGAWGWA